MAELSPAANAVWEAFNQDEAGVFVDYGEKLAAALRAVADQVAPQTNYSMDSPWCVGFADRDAQLRRDLLAIAAELEGADG